MISINSTFRVGIFGGWTSAPSDQNVNNQTYQYQRADNADNDQAVIFQKEQHSAAVEDCENSFDVVAERSRDHYRQEKFPTRILERSRSGDKDLERQRRRQYRWNSDRQETETFISAFDPFDLGELETLAQDCLPAASHDCVEQVATEHRSHGSEEWKVICGGRVFETTSDDEIVIYFRQRQEG